MSDLKLPRYQTKVLMHVIFAGTVKIKEDVNLSDFDDCLAKLKAAKLKLSIEFPYIILYESGQVFQVTFLENAPVSDHCRVFNTHDVIN